MTLVTHSLSRLQDLRPRLRGLLSASWRLVKTWQKLEIPYRVPPLPEDLLHTLCGFCILQGDRYMSLILETGFYAVLRTGEFLSLKARDDQFNPQFDCAVLNLGYTKTSQRTGAALQSESLHCVVVWRHEKAKSNLMASSFLFRIIFAVSLLTLHWTRSR